MSKRKIKVKDAEEKKETVKDIDGKKKDEKDQKDGSEPSPEKKADTAKKYDDMKIVDGPEKTEEPKAPPTPEETIAELTNQLQRLAAEFENYKKKNSREFDRGREFGAVELLVKLMPVLDSFDSAIQGEYCKSDSGILEGIEKIQCQLIDSLALAGLKAVEPNKGDPLDPNIHEVMFVQETTEIPSDTIFATFAKGYSYKDKLVRPAKVQVAKNPKEDAGN